MYHVKSDANTITIQGNTLYSTQRFMGMDTLWLSLLSFFGLLGGILASLPLQEAPGVDREKIFIYCGIGGYLLLVVPYFVIANIRAYKKNRITVDKTAEKIIWHKPFVDEASYEAAFSEIEFILLRKSTTQVRITGTTPPRYHKITVFNACVSTKKNKWQLISSTSLGEVRGLSKKIATFIGVPLAEELV